MGSAKVLKAKNWNESFNPENWCVRINSRGEVLIREKMDKESYLRVLDRTARYVVRDLPCPCNHPCSFCELPENPDYVIEICKSCGKIRAYDIITRVVKQVYDNCQPLQICKGPAGTLLLLDKHNLVIKLEWLNDKNDLRRKRTKAILIHGLNINAMCYVESLDMLVYTVKYPRSITAFCLGTDSRQWQIRGELVGLNADFLGLCCDPAGYIYVWNGQNDRMMRLDGKNKGEPEKDFLREEITGKIIAACWTVTQGQLTVLSLDADDVTLSSRAGRE